MLLNRVLFRAASGGTGTFTVSTGVTGYATPAGAGAVDGIVYSYMAQSDDLSQWEVGYGVYTASGTTLARTTVFNNSSGLTTNINFTNAPIVSVTPTTLDLYDTLQANRSYFVRTDGSDSNNGLANTAGGAFLTLQKAWNTIVGGLNNNGFNITVNVAAGTYAGLIIIGPWIGSGNVTFTGDTTTPSNVLISTTAADCIAILARSFPGELKFQGFKLTVSGGFNAGIFTQGPVTISGKMEFGATTGYHIFASTNTAYVQIQAAYTVTGATTWHNYSDNGATIQVQPSLGITLSGTLAFTGNFAVSAQMSKIIVGSSTTYTGGTITGNRYSVTTNALINANGGGVNLFPGDSAGTTDASGVYAV